MSAPAAAATADSAATNEQPAAPSAAAAEAAASSAAPAASGASATAASSSSSSAAAAAPPVAGDPATAFGDATLSHIHREGLETGTPVVWSALEDGFCCVCEEGEAYDDNPIVGCDSCQMWVHKECYGNPLVNKIPDDSWVCERCRWQAGTESCALCPVRVGAMKRTTDFRWAHLVCAQWIPEVFFRLPEGREPIDILMTPQKRHRQTCVYCNQTCGVCVECSDSTCKKWFHITCGQRNGIFLEYTPKANGADVIVSYCREHGKRWGKKKSGRTK